MIESDDTDQICLIDSNIWLYAFLETEESDKSRAAKEVIQKAGTAITVSTQIINEVCVNLVRKMNFSEEKTRELILHSEIFFALPSFFKISPPQSLLKFPPHL